MTFLYVIKIIIILKNYFNRLWGYFCNFRLQTLILFPLPSQNWDTHHTPLLSFFLPSPFLLSSLHAHTRLREITRQRERNIDVERERATDWERKDADRWRRRRRKRKERVFGHGLKWGKISCLFLMILVIPIGIEAIEHKDFREFY